VFPNAGDPYRAINAFSVRDGYFAICARTTGAPVTDFVVRAPVTGGTSEELAAVPVDHACRGVVSDGTQLYANIQDIPYPNILAVPVAGGAAVGFATDDAGSFVDHSLVVDDTYLYYASDNGSVRLPLAGGAVQSLGVSAEIGLFTRSVGGGTVAVTDGQRVRIAARDGLGVVYAADDQNATLSIVTDGDDTYWVRSEIKTAARWPVQAGTLWRRSGATASMLRADLSVTSMLQLDAESLYLYATPYVDGTAAPTGIYRMPR
jgi:hypothetical protein